MGEATINADAGGVPEAADGRGDRRNMSPNAIFSDRADVSLDRRGDGVFAEDGPAVLQFLDDIGGARDDDDRFPRPFPLGGPYEIVTSDFEAGHCPAGDDEASSFAIGG